MNHCPDRGGSPNGYPALLVVETDNLSTLTVQCVHLWRRLKPHVGKHQTTLANSQRSTLPPLDYSRWHLWLTLQGRSRLALITWFFLFEIHNLSPLLPFELTQSLGFKRFEWNWCFGNLRGWSIRHGSWWERARARRWMRLTWPRLHRSTSATPQLGFSLFGPIMQKNKTKQWSGD